MCESPIPYARHTIADDDRGQAFAVLESFITYAGHAVGDGDAFNGSIFYPFEYCASFVKYEDVDSSARRVPLIALSEYRCFTLRDFS